ncbi:hypothetical protein [Halovenus salina]|uniref:Uncharacterized protein n=1 Tax=Halovenus salina TaxID=1510225 RepID=A0ABD5W0V7_9EURY|nr:hypothetical protein [Halovenus salina]
MSDPPACGRDGCDRESEYLLTSGDRCREQALEDQPETVRYLAWATAGLENGGEQA